MPTSTSIFATRIVWYCMWGSWVINVQMSFPSKDWLVSTMNLHFYVMWDKCIILLHKLIFCEFLKSVHIMVCTHTNKIYKLFFLTISITDKWIVATNHQPVRPTFSSCKIINRKESIKWFSHRIQGKNYLFLGNESYRELLEVPSVWLPTSHHHPQPKYSLWFLHLL